MAYQVISQNNTTTTLADENGNVIRVPARVSLATSTDYTIKKVNNSTATLEDGNGNIIRDVPCVAVLVGGEGGGDQHNLGWYATESALTTAHPTATAGDWAIVGSTDTVWLWDTDNEEWVDSDQKGQVTSVNGQTGAVTVDALPTQTGNAGKFLTTDGTDASWSDKPLVNTATGTQAIGIGVYQYAISGSYAVAIGSHTGATGSGGVAVGNSSRADKNNCVSIGDSSNSNFGTVTQGSYSVAVGASTKTDGNYSIAVGYYAIANGIGGIQLGKGTNSTAGTMSVGLSTDGTNWNNYELLSADGTIPAARHAALPAADGTYTLQLVITNGVPTLSWVAV